MFNHLVANYVKEISFGETNISHILILELVLLRNRNTCRINRWRKHLFDIGIDQNILIRLTLHLYQLLVSYLQRIWLFNSFFRSRLFILLCWLAFLIFHDVIENLLFFIVLFFFFFLWQYKFSIQAFYIVDFYWFHGHFFLKGVF